MREWTEEEKNRFLESPDQIRELYKKVRRSDFRQTYHIQPVTGLLNDPNGFLHANGEWHLFYQWYPYGAEHGLKHWYHVVSKDLVNWNNCGLAIAPDKWYDNGGAFSGSALVMDGKLYLYYTGIHTGDDGVVPYTCLAELFQGSYRVHKKDEPLFGPQEGYTHNQRDPKIIKLASDRYVIILGAQNDAHQGRVIVYESRRPDRGFKFKGEINVPGFMDFGDMWECPSIQKISGYDVLMFCPQHITLKYRGQSQNHNGYIIGSMDWDELVFTPVGQFHELDFGFDAYAAECAARKRSWSETTLISWMGIPDATYPTDGEEWSGCLTLPRNLRVRNRRLIQEPLAELAALRDDEADPLLEILPKACELNVYNQEEDLELHLFTKYDHSGGISICYDSKTKILTVDRSEMTLTFNNDDGNVRTRKLDGGLDHLRIFIDSSSVEIFVNNGDAVFTSRVFPLDNEHYFQMKTRAEVHIWKLKNAVCDDFIV
ncbi:MAG: sucrose-6-phosphate hydrolase [Lachnospiraceae bacterium]|nr:sucrose-6-phosphate hydrolase [Lachnospiraceae bacterium]